MTFIKPGLMTLVVLALLGSFAPDATAQRVRLRVELTPTNVEPLASGKAKFEMRGTVRMKFSTEAEDLVISNSISVFVAGEFIGTAAVNAFGTADLNRDSRRGHFIPEMFAGDLVEVFNENGDLILFGQLAVD